LPESIPLRVDRDAERLARRVAKAVSYLHRESEGAAFVGVPDRTLLMKVPGFPELKLRPGGTCPEATVQV
jgi:hypothetical protein